MTTAWSDAAFAALAPRPRISISEWADRYRVVAAGTSPEPDRWRTSRVPYLREPMDSISDPAVERVVVMAGSQLGKSELMLNVIGYYADADPSPMLLVQPTEIAMKSFRKERIVPTFRATPALAHKVTDSLRDGQNTEILMKFDGGYLAYGWATSAVSLASRPIRVVLGDEIDRWPGSTGADGDPWAQAVQRTANFHNRKIVAVSTPTIEGLSAIANLYEDSDQRHYHVPCPHCGTLQVLQWGNLIYKNATGAIDLDGIYYRCGHCAERIEERSRPEMLAEGEWIPDHPEHRHRGYQISGLYSPWVRWAELAREWIKAHADRDRRGQQEFLNLRLGETWSEEAAQVHADSLEKNREHYDAEVPEGVVLLTAGADVQDNRIEVEIVGWGAGKQSWGIHYAIFHGDTSQPAVWEMLAGFLGRTWQLPSGARLSLWRSCVDSGGHRADEVYEFCRRHAPRVAAIKGRGGPGIPITTGKPTIVGQERWLLYIVGADAGKDALYSRLMLAEPGPGYCHFPAEVTRGYDSEYFKGLCSEKRKQRMRGGRRVSEWVQVYQRNEPLDCRNYATAAMEMALIVDGVDLDKLVAPPAPLPTIPDGAPRAAMTSASPPRRRVLSRGISW